MIYSEWAHRGGGAHKAWSMRGLLLFVFAYPILEGLSNSLFPIGTKAVLVPLFGIWLTETAWTQRLRWSWPAGLVGAYACWATASVLWSRAPLASATHSLLVLQSSVLFLIILDVVDTRQDALRVMRAYVLGVAVLVATAIPNILSGTTYGGLHNRFSALGTDPNSFGLYVATTIPLVLMSSVVRLRGAGLIRVLYVVTTSFVVLSTASRASSLAYLLVLFGSGSAYFAFTKAGPVRAATVAVVVVAAASVMLAAIPEQALDRLGAGAGDDAGGRLPAWKLALSYASTSPLVGIGAGALAEVTKVNVTGGLQAHNTFLSNFAELGVVGLGLWSTIWLVQGWCVVRLWGNRGTKEAGVALGLMSVVVFVGLATLNWEVRRPVYVLLGLTSAVAFKSGAMLKLMPNPRRPLVNYAEARPAPRLGRD